MMELKHRALMPGVQLTVVQTNKFKTSTIAMSFLAPLSSDTAAANALLPAVLRRGSAQHPDMLSLSAALDDLYGGTIEPMVRKKGETQCIGFLGSFLDDAYIPEQSNILEAAAALMGELILQPAGSNHCFVPAYLDSERENLILRIQSRMNDKQQYAMYRLIQNMFAGEPYGIDALGEASRAQAIDNAHLWQRYQDLLHTAPIELYYCGSAPIDRVEAAMKQALSGLPSGERTPLLPIEASCAPSTEAPRFFEDHMDITQGKLTMGFRLPAPCTTPEATATMMVFNAIYGGSTNSKLFLNVREKLSLCYYASTATDRHKGIVLLSSGIAFEQYDKAKDEILAQLDDCRKGNITETDLESARRFVVNHQRITDDAQNRLEDFWLAQAVAGRDETPSALAAAAEAVTLENVQQLAQALRLDSIYFLQGKEGTDA